MAWTANPHIEHDARVPGGAVMIGPGFGEAVMRSFAVAMIALGVVIGIALVLLSWGAYTLYQHIEFLWK